MRFVSLRTLLLMTLACFGLISARLSAKILRVFYYPDSSSTSQVLAISPDGTDSGPVNNPTYTLRPNTTVEFPIADGTRIWVYTPYTGWRAGPSEANPDFGKDYNLAITGYSYEPWLTAGAKSSTSLWLILGAGFLIAWCIFGVLDT